MRLINWGIWGAAVVAAGVAASCNNVPEIIREANGTHTRGTGGEGAGPEPDAGMVGPVTMPDAAPPVTNPLECLKNAMSDDADGDGVKNDVDNCPCDKNPAQRDFDKDGIGDTCDNCGGVANTDQLDKEHDGVGDACKGRPTSKFDEDGDGVIDGDDNCYSIANPDQADSDGDLVGDACDDCPTVANNPGPTGVQDPAVCMGAGIPDGDKDTVPDPVDNCPKTKNTDQADRDKDGVGDACDNCPDVPNYSQADTDKTDNGEGDACEGAMTDTDGDGVSDRDDNCPLVKNDQKDSDKDSIGDACDDCPDIANYDQKDTDGNGTGDACEGPGGGTKDTDGDGVPDSRDNCFKVANPTQKDGDGDLIGDDCDNCPTIANATQDPAACAFMDGDKDGVPDPFDDCPAVADPNQIDTDKDGRGDACDNCPVTPNYQQKDTDGNGRGDACENFSGIADFDKDGVPDLSDNCPKTKNADQADADGDKIGDVCDNCPQVKNPFQEDTDTDPANGPGDACKPIFIPPDKAPICASGSTAATRVKPNVYILLDHSSSMQTNAFGNGTRWTVVKDTLVQLGPTLTANFNIGLGIFPSSNNSCARSALPDPRLALATTNTNAQFQAAVTALPTPPTTQPLATTPTANALNSLASKALFNIPGDTVPGRQAVVVLITDGEPNRGNNVDDCTPFPQILDVPNTAAAVTNLFQTDKVPVYVIGLAGVNDAAMTQIAAGGGTTNPNDPTRNWFPVNAPMDLINALNAIVSATVSCSFDLTINSAIGVPDFNRSSVVLTIQNTPQNLARTDFTITTTATATTLTLGATACNELKAAAGTSPPPKVEVKSVCNGTCPGNTEICDNLKDDNCNGQTDEGCGTTCVCGSADPKCPTDCGPGCVPKPEVCDNGKDDDCDGMIDEGCCTPKKEICGNDKDDDCDGVIDNGCDCGPEVCDGMDNNCDGVTDEGCPPPNENCVCGESKPGCKIPKSECPPPGCDPMSEVCDGMDNDCDGMVDEGCCDATSTRDDCDGIDNNCNGSYDEDCKCGPEICDGIDNDCDNMIDEGCPPKTR